MQESAKVQARSDEIARRMHDLQQQLARSQAGHVGNALPCAAAQAMQPARAAHERGRPAGARTPAALPDVGASARLRQGESADAVATRTSRSPKRPANVQSTQSSCSASTKSPAAQARQPARHVYAAQSAEALDAEASQAAAPVLAPRQGAVLAIARHPEMQVKQAAAAPAHQQQGMQAHCGTSTVAKLSQAGSKVHNNTVVPTATSAKIATRSAPAVAAGPPHQLPTCKKQQQADFTRGKALVSPAAARTEVSPGRQVKAAAAVQPAPRSTNQMPANRASAKPEPAAANVQPVDPAMLEQQMLGLAMLGFPIHYSSEAHSVQPAVKPVVEVRLGSNFAIVHG